MGTKKRRPSKRRRAGVRGPTGTAQGNRRRRPRAHAESEPTTAAPTRRSRASSASAKPPGKGRGIIRFAARWGLRIGVAAGVAYAGLWGVREGYEYATTSPRFEVRGLIFTATRHVDDTRLRELMGIDPGTNILALDLDGLAKSISADPWVAKASVTRVLPDSLDVTVEEHVPAAVLLAGSFYLVSDTGKAFKPLEPGERGELPVITGLDQATLFTDPDGAAARIDQALEVLVAYSAKRRPRLSEVNLDATGAVTLYTSELGSQLRLGRGDIEPALRRFDALRAALGEESDKLAVAHLDSVTGPDASDRVVASFFPTKQAPSFVSDASRRASAKAQEHADLLARAEEHRKRNRGATQGKKRSRLPRYE